MPKRVFDILASSLGLVLLSPPLALIALFLLASGGRPVLFRQTRPGRSGRPFEILKFRTMREAVGLDGDPRPDADRLTATGRVLRSLSLDELPELWNVLMGDMSLVGPRPLLMQYLPLYSPEQARRHEVRPGITGWAQVNGRNAATWKEKLEMDVWYVDNQTFWLDLRILARTLLQVVRREGINQPGQATAEPFKGNQEDHSA
jgi:lipopolysaccharide/colanic/teichoic acid biosynthesis glycosyltransferase